MFYPLDFAIVTFIVFSQLVSILELGDVENMVYTLKALSTFLWAYFYAESFEQDLLKILNEGGDADINAAVALLGEVWFSEYP